MKVIAATGNKGKLREMEEILSPLGIEIVSRSDAGIELEVEETGSTFEENALIKARAAALVTDCCVLADDSGLCVDALDGAPGVHSARYAGEGASDERKIKKLLSQLDGVEDRSARFVTAIAFIFPDGREIKASGEVKGYITKEPSGSGGFGYDPVFFSEELGKTFAECDDAEKNSVSHRARALKNLYNILVNTEVR